MTKKHSKATWQSDSTWWPTLELWNWCHASKDQILNRFATNQKIHIWKKCKLDFKKYRKSDVEKYKHCQRHNGPRHCFYNLIYFEREIQIYYEMKRGNNHFICVIIWRYETSEAGIWAKTPDSAKSGGRVRLEWLSFDISSGFQKMHKFRHIEVWSPGEQSKYSL